MRYAHKHAEGERSETGIIAHVIDIGANYWSLWNFHQISVKNLVSYYQAYPAAFDRINRRIGYRVKGVLDSNPIGLDLHRRSLPSRIANVRHPKYKGAPL